MAIIALTVVSLGGLAGASSASAALLGLPTVYPTETSASSVAIRDLSGDGRPDVAVTHPGSDGVSIRLGTGGGALGPPTTYGMGSGPQYAAISDLDGDGRRDLVVANPDTGAVSVRMGTGAGALGPRAAYPAAAATSLQVADLDGDGQRDVVVTDRRDDAVAVLLGTGGGHFGAPRLYPVPGPSAVAIGDLDGDHAPDLAVASLSNDSGNFSVLLGTGTGRFGSTTTYDDGPHQTEDTAVAIGDVDEDGIPDAVLVGMQGDDEVSVFPGLGHGAFGPALTFPLEGSWASAVALADLDLDGHLDLVVDTPGFERGGPGGLLVRRGRGDGGFRSGLLYPAGRLPTSLAVHDLDGDGRPDAAATDSAGGLAVLLNGRPGAAVFHIHFISVLDSQPVGSHIEAPATITNDGTEPLVISSLTPRGADSPEFSADPGTCARAVQPAATCTFGIGFDPVTAGWKDVWLEVVSNAVGSPYHFSFFARGLVDAPRIGLHGKLVFESRPVGTMSQPNRGLVTVHSGGTQPLHVTSVTTTDPAQFAIHADTCSGQTLASGTSCTFRGRFTPTTPGAKNARVVVASDAEGGAQSLPMTGTALSAPWPVFTGDTAFGPQPVGTAATRLVRLTNRGSESLIASPPWLTGLNPGQFSLFDNTCATVPAGDSCIFRVRFAPTGLGAKSARVIVPDNAPGSPHEVRVSGTGT